MRPVAVPYQPNGARVSDVLDALAAVSHMAADVEAPCWLGNDALPLPLAPHELLPVGNGLLHLPSGELHAATPQLFCLNATKVQFDPKAPAPRRWRKFLKQLWGEDHAVDRDARRLVRLSPHARHPATEDSHDRRAAPLRQRHDCQGRSPGWSARTMW